jgi:hypothetical protein
MNRILQESIENNDFEDQVVLVDSLEFKKTVSAFAGYSDLVQVKIEAYQEGQALDSLSQILKAGHENKH